MLNRRRGGRTNSSLKELSRSATEKQAEPANVRIKTHERHRCRIVSCTFCSSADSDQNLSTEPSISILIESKTWHRFFNSTSSALCMSLSNDNNLPTDSKPSESVCPRCQTREMRTYREQSAAHSLRWVFRGHLKRRETESL